MNAAQALLREVLRETRESTYFDLSDDLHEAITEELERADTHPDVTRIRASMDRQAERKRLRNLLPDALQDGD